MSLAAEAANLGMWVWDVVRDEIWTTDKGRVLFGFAPDERLDYAALSTRVHPEDRENKCNKEPATQTKIPRLATPVPPIVIDPRCRNQSGKHRYSPTVPGARWNIRHLVWRLEYHPLRCLWD